MKIAINIILSSLKSRAMLAAYIALSISAGFLVLLSNDRLRRLLDDGLLFQESGVFLPAFFLVALLFLLVLLSGVLSTYLMEKIKWDCEAKLKEHYINKLLKSDYSYFVNKETPGIWSLLNTSTQYTTNIVDISVSIISRIISFIFFCIIIFSINFYAGILSVAATPLYLVATAYVGRSFMRLQQQAMEGHREMAVVAQEALSNVSIVKTKDAYGFFVARIMKVQYVIAGLMRKFNVLQQYLVGVSAFIGVLTPVVILFGAIQLSDATVSTGDIVVLFINIPLFLERFRSIHAAFVLYKSFKPGLKHLDELNAVPGEPIAEIRIDGFESLETTDVSVSFGDKTVKIPNIGIKKDEKVMFSGESGIGKSTLFNILTGLILDYKGIVKVNGIDIRLICLQNLRKVIGIAFQSTGVLTVSLRENTSLGLQGQDARVDELLKLSGLEQQLKDKADDILNDKVLSGGEKSRLGLAQLLMTDPDVLLIDETFSNVDEDMEKIIMERLLEKYSNKTIIYIGHRTTSRGFFDRVVEF